MRGRRERNGGRTARRSRGRHTCGAPGPPRWKCVRAGAAASAAPSPAREGKRKRGGRGAALGDVARPAPTGTVCPGRAGGGSAAVPVSALRCWGTARPALGGSRAGGDGCRAERGAGIAAASRGAGEEGEAGSPPGTGTALRPGHWGRGPRSQRSVPLSEPDDPSGPPPPWEGPAAIAGETSRRAARPASPPSGCHSQTPGVGCSAVGRC